jgi:hypothetical protein
MTKKQRIFSFLFTLYWIILWLSINTSPIEEGLLSTINLIDFNENFGLSIGFLRIVVALLSTYLIILYFIFIFFKKKNKNNKIYIFTILSFFSQLVGLYLNQERSFDVFNTFLPFLCIGCICLFLLCDQIEIENIIKYFFWIAFFLLCIVFITILSFKLTDIKNLNFYSLFSPKDSNIIGHNNPRASGLSRTLAIINLFLIIYLFSLKNFFMKNFLLLFAVLLSIVIILIESRGTLFSYFISLTFIILFLINKNNSFRIKYFLKLIILPIVLSIFILNNYTDKEPPTKNDKIINSRIVAFHTSGRFEILAHIFKKYDYKKIFGYGPQGDRFFLKKDYPGKEKGYGDNSSNILAYTLLSGGFVSVLFGFLVFFEIFKILIRNKKNLLFNKDSFYLNLSISCLIFFLSRSMIENSFGVFGIDFLMTYLSIAYILNSSKILIK